MRFQCWLKLTMHSSADLQGMKKLPAAKSQQRIFTLFSSVWLGIVPKGSSSLLSLAAKQKNLKNPISNNYENKHFSVKELLFSSVDTCITITRTLYSNSREKSLEMQHKKFRVRKQKARRDWRRFFPRQRHTMCFMYGTRRFHVMIFMSRVSTFSGVWCNEDVCTAHRIEIG